MDNFYCLLFHKSSPNNLSLELKDNVYLASGWYSSLQETSQVVEGTFGTNRFQSSLFKRLILFFLLINIYSLVGKNLDIGVVSITDLRTSQMKSYCCYHALIRDSSSSWWLHFDRTPLTYKVCHLLCLALITGCLLAFPLHLYLKSSFLISCQRRLL